MTDTVIPATPGFVLRGEDGTERPIVGWRIPDGEYDASPITPAELTGGEIINLPAMTHVTALDRVQAVEAAFARAPRPVAEDAARQSGPVPRSQLLSDADRANEAALRSQGNVPGAVGPFQIPFTGKTYERVSNWHYIGDPSFVFELPANTGSPKTSLVQKINRDGAAKLRKEEGLVELDYAQVTGQAPLPAGFWTGGYQPEDDPVSPEERGGPDLEPGTLGGAEIVGDDDGMDLV